MTSYLGMDVSDVRQRAAHLNFQAAQVAQVQAALSAIFASSTWIGADADHAQNELNAAILPALNMVRQFAEETASLMIISADQQEAASSP